jgi:uncharacterized membrane protein
MTDTKPNPLVEGLTKAAAGFVSAKAGQVVTNIGDKAAGKSDGQNDGGDDQNGDNGGDDKGVIGHTVENISEGGSTVGSAVKGVGSAIKDKVKNLFKGSGSAKRPNNIVEDLFVGVTPEVAFAAWTDYEEWSSFSKGIENVNVKRGEESEDKEAEEESNWTAKVFLSRRSWNATTTDFDPPNRIAWTSEGAKGTIDGTVTFTPVGENATLILVVMEYRTKGPVEWIANRWRAAERRAKLDIKHFRRYVMRANPDELPEPVEEPEDHVDEGPEEPTDETPDTEPDEGAEEPTNEVPDEPGEEPDEGAEEPGAGDEPEPDEEPEPETEPDEGPDEEPEPEPRSRPARRARG